VNQRIRQDIDTASDLRSRRISARSSTTSTHFLPGSTLVKGVRPRVSARPTTIKPPSGWRDLNSRPVDPQISAAWPRTSPDVQFSLEIRILDLGAFLWTKANGGQNGGQTHSQAKRIGLAARMAMPIELRVTTKGFRPLLAAIRQQTLCLEAVFKAHLRPEQHQGSRASD
jgi:hypothetical protein